MIKHCISRIVLSLFRIHGDYDKIIQDYNEYKKKNWNNWQLSFLSFNHASLDTKLFLQNASLVKSNVWPKALPNSNIIPSKEIVCWSVDHYPQCTGFLIQFIFNCSILKHSRMSAFNLHCRPFKMTACQIWKRHSQSLCLSSCLPVKCLKMASFLT